MPQLGDRETTDRLSLTHWVKFPSRTMQNPRPNFHISCSGSSNTNNFQTFSNTVQVAYSETLHLGELQHFTELTWSILTCWIGACSIINYIHELRWDDVTVSVTWYFTQRRHGLLKFQPSCCTTKPTMKALSIVISEANEDILTEK